MFAPSGFGAAHVTLVVFATLGKSQATEITQLNYRSGSNTTAIGQLANSDAARKTLVSPALVVTA